MQDPLPPDLARLGDHLTAATARAGARGRRNAALARLGVTGAAAALAPVPAFAIGLLYGEMAEIVTKGQNAVPRRTLELGYRPRHADLDEALRTALR